MQNLSVLRQIKTAVLITAEGAEVDPAAPTVDGNGFAKAAIAKGMAALERLVAAATQGASATGLFSAGTTTPSIADICIAPQVYNARRFGVDVDQFPAVMQAFARCEAIEAFKAALPELQPDAPKA